MTEKLPLEGCLKAAFKEAFGRLQNLNRDKIRHVNEAVFRYWFIEALCAQDKFDEAYAIEDEWHRIDLALIAIEKGNRHALIEFKFYDARPLHKPDGQKNIVRHKGGAGTQNLKEFIESTVRLDDGQRSTLVKEGFSEENSSAYFVMVYVDRKGRATPFSKYYGTSEGNKEIPMEREIYRGQKSKKYQGLAWPMAKGAHLTLEYGNKTLRKFTFDLPVCAAAKKNEESYVLQIIDEPEFEEESAPSDINLGGWIARLGPPPVD